MGPAAGVMSEGLDQRRQVGWADVPRWRGARRVRAAVVATILILAAWVRMAGLHDRPFWLDEVFSHDFTRGSVAETLEATARDTHPPLYYLGLQATTRLLGASEPVIVRRVVLLTHGRARVHRKRSIPV